LPSKIHACIESGKRVLFVGSEDSDIHLLASHALSSDRYFRVDVADVAGLVTALNIIERAVKSEHDVPIVPSDLLDQAQSNLRANVANG
jgi:hypothetical protein